MKKIYTFLFILTVCTQFNTFATNFYLQSSSNWSTATWYNSASGGSTIQGVPTATDNVFTNGHVLTVDGIFSCNNITVANTTGGLTINSPNILNVYGELIGPGWTGTNLIAGTGTVDIKATSGIIVTGWENGSSFQNLVIDPGAGNTVLLDPNGAYLYTTSTGQITINSGTVNEVGGGGNNIIGSNTTVGGTLTIAPGATLNISNGASICASGSYANCIGTLNINGTLIQNNSTSVNAANITIGTNGVFQTYAQTIYTCTPTTFNCYGTTKYMASGNQNICPGYYRDLTVGGTGMKSLTNTTGIDSLHFIWANCPAGFSANGQTLNIPSTGSGITPLSGTYIVSQTGNYDFLSYLDVTRNLLVRNVATSGATFNFMDNEVFSYSNYYDCSTYLYDLNQTYGGPIIIGRTGSVGAPNPPTFYLNATNGSQTGNAVLKIYNTSNITIDGIAFQAANINVQYGIYLSGVSNVTIQNCNINLANSALAPNTCGVWNQSVTGIVISTSAASSNINLYNNTIQNCDIGISNAWYASPQVASTGIVIGAFGKGNQISNFRQYGICIGSVQSPPTTAPSVMIIGNNIYNSTATVCNTTGIAAGCSGTSYVTYNKIHNLTNSSSAQNSKLTGISLNTSVSTDVIYCYNNMVYDMQTPNASYSSFFIPYGNDANELGITTYTDGHYYIIYNTVFFGNTNITTGNTAEGISVGQPISNGLMTLENNLIVINNTPYSAGTYNNCYYFSSGLSASHYKSDYNLLCAGDSTVFSNIIGVKITSEFQKFGTYRPYMVNNEGGDERHSVTEYNTPFVSTTEGSMDVHLSGSSLALDGGTPITVPIAITDDIDGDTRSTTSPTIGADEVVIPANGFIQDITFTGTEYIKGIDILAGDSITNQTGYGPVIIQSGANVTFDGENNIILEKGFIVKSGGGFIAK